MKAIIYTNFGPPEVLRLEEVAIPAPRGDKVLVKIYTTIITIWLRIMRSLNKPIPCYQRILAGL